MKDVKMRRVLAPINGGRGDARLLEALGSLCSGGASRITLVYVVEVPMSLPLDAEMPLLMDRGERVLAHAEAKLREKLQGRDAIVLTELLQARSAGPAICDSAHDHQANLIVMATQNRHEHGKTSYGVSVDHVLKFATSEVVVIRLSLSDVAER
jgi:nucleotide-binding universal stress UspA family protein